MREIGRMEYLVKEPFLWSPDGFRRTQVVPGEAVSLVPGSSMAEGLLADGKIVEPRGAKGKGKNANPDHNGSGAE